MLQGVPQQVLHQPGQCRPVCPDRAGHLLDDLDLRPQGLQGLHLSGDHLLQRYVLQLEDRRLPLQPVQLQNVQQGPVHPLGLADDLRGVVPLPVRGRRLRQILGAGPDHRQRCFQVVGDGGGGLPPAALIEQVGPLPLPGHVGQQPGRQQEPRQTDQGGGQPIGARRAPHIRHARYHQPAVGADGIGRLGDVDLVQRAPGPLRHRRVVHDGLPAEVSRVVRPGGPQHGRVRGDSLKIPDHLAVGRRCQGVSGPHAAERSDVSEGVGGLPGLVIAVVGDGQHRVPAGGPQSQGAGDYLPAGGEGHILQDQGHTEPTLGLGGRHDLPKVLRAEPLRNVHLTVALSQIVRGVRQFHGPLSRRVHMPFQLSLAGEERRRDPFGPLVGSYDRQPVAVGGPQILVAGAPERLAQGVGVILEPLPLLPSGVGEHVGRKRPQQRQPQGQQQGEAPQIHPPLLSFQIHTTTPPPICTPF